MLKVIGAIIAFAGIVVTSMYLLQPEASAFSLETASPDKAYQLNLVEQLEPSGDHHVKLSVSKYGVVMFQDEPLYGGDRWDGRFNGLYPQHDWISNSIIHFGHKDMFAPGQDDSIVVVNKSKSTFSYFLVNTGRENMYLLFDFQPGATVTISTEPQTKNMADASEISYRGKLADNRAFNHGFALFDIKGATSGPAHYKVVVDDSVVTVTSQEFPPLKSN